MNPVCNQTLSGFKFLSSTRMLIFVMFCVISFLFTTSDNAFSQAITRAPNIELKRIKGNSHPVMVTIKHVNKKEKIYFTIDGSTPQKKRLNAGTYEYNGPFMTKAGLVKAMSTVSGLRNSNIIKERIKGGILYGWGGGGSGDAPKTPTPIIESGPEINASANSMYNCPVVHVRDVNDEALLYVTSDGNPPNISSTPSGGPGHTEIAVKGPTSLVQAIAKVPGYEQSDAVTATITCPIKPAEQMQPPIIVPSNNDSLSCPYYSVNITSNQPTAQIYYYDQSATLQRFEYGKIKVDRNNLTVKAIAIDSRDPKNRSNIAEMTYVCDEFIRLVIDITSGNDDARSNSAVYARLNLSQGPSGDACLKPSNASFKNHPEKIGYEWSNCTLYRNQGPAEGQDWYDWKGGENRKFVIDFAPPISASANITGTLDLILEQHPRDLEGWDNWDIKNIKVELGHSSGKVSTKTLLEFSEERLTKDHSVLHCRFNSNGLPGSCSY